MTEACYNYEQETNKEELNPTFLNHLFDEFVEFSTTKEDVAKLELKNYIEGKGEWNIEVTKDSEEQSTEPTEDNSLPLKVVNNYYLGNILKTVFSDIYSTEEKNDVSCVKS